jgi:hypothetical protein
MVSISVMDINSYQIKNKAGNRKLYNKCEDIEYFSHASIKGAWEICVRLAWCHSKGCKSLTRPNSGKCTAEDKGVRRETESEGSLRQTSGLTYRNLI